MGSDRPSSGQLPCLIAGPELTLLLSNKQHLARSLKVAFTYFSYQFPTREVSPERALNFCPVLLSFCGILSSQSEIDIGSLPRLSLPNRLKCSVRYAGRGGGGGGGGGAGPGFEVPLAVPGPTMLCLCGM